MSAFNKSATPRHWNVTSKLSKSPRRWANLSLLPAFCIKSEWFTGRMSSMNWPREPTGRRWRSRCSKATGDAQAAAQARERAIASYLAYRRDGGENRTTAAQLSALVAHAIQQGNTTEAEQILARYHQADAPPSFKVMLSKLQTILRGA